MQLLPQEFFQLLQKECTKNTSEIFQDLRGAHFKIVRKESTEYSFKR